MSSTRVRVRRATDCQRPRLPPQRKQTHCLVSHGGQRQLQRTTLANVWFARAMFWSLFELHRKRAHLVTPRSLCKHLEICRLFDRVAHREKGTTLVACDDVITHEELLFL